MPSVRGPERILVATLLLVAAAGAGGVAGFVLGAAAEVAGLDGPLPRGVITGGVVLAVVLDLLLTPLSVRRQVPQLWGRIFSARTTAVLYGARLGVGPLTILRTWWWWLAALLGATTGAWWSAAVGATFGATRVVVMLPVGTRAGGFRRSERVAVALGLVAAVGVSASVALVPDPDAPVDVADRPAPVAASRERVAPTTTTAITAAPADAGLAAALLADLGGGYERLADDPARALGPLDLAAAARVEQDEPAERSLLETRHFEAGHSRAWRHDDGRVAYAAVYRFATPADAAAYLVDGFITLEGRGAAVYDVADPPGARGFSQAAATEGTSDVAHGVAFVRDRHFFLVVESATSSAATASGAQALARALWRQ